MFDGKKMEEIAEKMMKNLPETVKTLSAEVRDNIRSAFKIGLGKLDVVTREEFDAQKAVLERTREKLELLEKQVDALISKK